MSIVAGRVWALLRAGRGGGPQRRAKPTKPTCRHRRRNNRQPTTQPIHQRSTGRSPRFRGFLPSSSPSSRHPSAHKRYTVCTARRAQATSWETSRSRSGRTPECEHQRPVYERMSCDEWSDSVEVNLSHGRGRKGSKGCLAPAMRVSMSMNTYQHRPLYNKLTDELQSILIHRGFPLESACLDLVAHHLNILVTGFAVQCEDQRFDIL